jgi:hypothetical protein
MLSLMHEDDDGDDRILRTQCPSVWLEGIISAAAVTPAENRNQARLEYTSEALPIEPSRSLIWIHIGA